MVDETYAVPAPEQLARKQLDETKTLLAWAGIIKSISFNPDEWTGVLSAKPEAVRQLIVMAVAFSQVDFTPEQNKIALRFYTELNKTIQEGL